MLLPELRSQRDYLAILPWKSPLCRLVANRILVVERRLAREHLILSYEHKYKGVRFLVRQVPEGFFAIVALETGPCLVYNGVTGNHCSNPKGAYFFAKRFIKAALDGKLSFHKPVYWKSIVP